MGVFQMCSSSSVQYNTRLLENSESENLKLVTIKIGRPYHHAAQTEMFSINNFMSFKNILKIQLTRQSLNYCRYVEISSIDISIINHFVYSLYCCNG